MRFIKPKPILQRTSHRGHLEISPHVKIPVIAMTHNCELSTAQIQITYRFGHSSRPPRESFLLSRRSLLFPSCVCILYRWFPPPPTLTPVVAAGDETASMEVKPERNYHSFTDPDMEVGCHQLPVLVGHPHFGRTQVAPDERVKGYRYGKTLVPFSMVDEAVLKYEAEKTLQLVGFTSSKNVPRKHFLLRFCFV